MFADGIYKPEPSFTWATKPSASGNTGVIIRVTDVGPTIGSRWISDGTYWKPENGILLWTQSAIPVGIPSSGTIGNNGALSGITALAFKYSGCYMYFNVEVIASGIPAGLYWVVPSSTTAGTIYNNTYSGGIPTRPSSPTAFSTTGGGSYTQSTAEITVATCGTIYAHMLGLNGGVRVLTGLTNNNSANTKTLKVKAGSTSLWSLLSTTNIINEHFVDCRLRGIENAQFASRNNQSIVGALGTTLNGSFLTVDFGTDLAMTISLQLINAADTVFLEGYTLELQIP